MHTEYTPWTDQKYKKLHWIHYFPDKIREKKEKFQNPCSKEYQNVYEKKEEQRIKLRKQVKCV